MAPTVPWLNLWATYDFVSFLAAGTWPGRVEDREIPTQVGFPAAHGSYFTSDDFGARDPVAPGGGRSCSPDPAKAAGRDPQGPEDGGCRGA